MMKCDNCDKMVYDGMVWQGKKWTTEEWIKVYGNKCVFCVARVALNARKKVKTNRK